MLSPFRKNPAGIIITRSLQYGKECAFRFHQVEINDLLEARVFRLKITVYVRPGNQVIEKAFPNLPA